MSIPDVLHDDCQLTATGVETHYFSDMYVRLEMVYMALFRVYKWVVPTVLCMSGQNARVSLSDSSY